LVGGQATFLPDTSRLENELRTAQQRLLMISRATTDAIWEWDMQSGHIFRNETLMTMIGYQQDNSRGLSWWLRRIHPHDRDRVADTVKEATENNQQYWQEEYRFRCADGAYKHIRDKGFVVYENGLPVKMIGSLQDISGLKELEGKLMDERLQQQKENAEMVMKVQEKERSRISKELHDNVNQLLSTSRLFIDAINTKDDSQRQIKEKSVEYLQMAVDEIRKLSKELSSPHLQQNTLEDILHTMVEDINMTGRIKMKMDYDPQAEALSIGKKTTLFRIIQEQVKNIIRHSEATSAAISLHTGQGQVALSIEDNGKGFEPGQTHRGIGLANIQERSNYYNGKATISSGPGKGCILTVLLPCED
ncbi:MAG TPA: PAS domain-containing protein, partial [Chitinophagaceae bacterium]|nr:PAS domain-containing protein [Chitinophagaceae bacterium]